MFRFFGDFDQPAGSFEELRSGTRVGGLLATVFGDPLVLFGFLEVLIKWFVLG